MKEKQNIYDFIFSTTALAKTINIILFRSLKFLIQSDLDFVNRFGRAKKLTESNINKIEKNNTWETPYHPWFGNSKFVNNFENSQYRG